MLSMQGVRYLYRRIDNATNGLGSVLEKSLEEVAAAKNPAPAPVSEPAETPAEKLEN